MCTLYSRTSTAIGAAFLAATGAAADPVEIGWADLVPGATGGAPTLQGVVQHEQIAQLPQADPAAGAAPLSPAQFRTDLNGQEVEIAGYVLPIAFEGTDLVDFLLVPYVGACIHVPPPPANQLVFVTSDHGVPISGLFDAVIVTGLITVSNSSTEFADAGYTITASRVERTN